MLHSLLWLFAFCRPSFASYQWVKFSFVFVLNFDCISLRNSEKIKTQFSFGSRSLSFCSCRCHIACVFFLVLVSLTRRRINKLSRIMYNGIYKYCSPPSTSLNINKQNNYFSSLLYIFFVQPRIVHKILKILFFVLEIQCNCFSISGSNNSTLHISPPSLPKMTQNKTLLFSNPTSLANLFNNCSNSLRFSFISCSIDNRRNRKETFKTN